jgi:hypothetical protein
MSDAILAYLVSLGIIGGGVFWIVMGASAASTVCIAIGIPTIVVGLLSFFAELRET